MRRIAVSIEEFRDASEKLAAKCAEAFNSLSYGQRIGDLPRVPHSPHATATRRVLGLVVVLNYYPGLGEVIPTLLERYNIRFVANHKWIRPLVGRAVRRGCSTVCFSSTGKNGIGT